MADETAAGIQAFGALADQTRKRLAYNALASTYGPAANDPEAWGASVKAASEEAQLPYAGPQAEANLAQTGAQTNYLGTQAAEGQQKIKLTEAQSQRESQVRAIRMLKNSVDPQSGSVSAEDYDKIVGENADALGLDAKHAWPLRQQLTAPGGAKHLDDMESALLAPVQATGAPQIARDADGNTVAVRFDKYGKPIVNKLDGLTTTSQQRADTGSAAQQVRADQGAQGLKIRQQVANTGSAREGVYAANQTFGAAGGGGQASGGGAAGGGAQPGGQDAGAAAPESKAPLIDKLPLKGQLQVRSSAQGLVNNSQTIQNSNVILDRIDEQLKPFTTGMGSLLSKLPGTLQNDLRANLQTVKAQGLQTWLQSMKNAQGQTGLGRILQAEVQNAMSLYGNMEQDQTTTQLKLHLGLFKQAIARIDTNGRAAFQSTWKTSPEAAIGVPERGAKEALSDDALLAKYSKGK